MIHYPLLPYSQLVQKVLQDNPSAFWYTWRLRLNPQIIDVERLKNAVVRAVHTHGVLGLVGNEKYYTIDVLENAEIELLVRINRILGDGRSIQILAEDILRAYRGEDLQADDYEGWLRRWMQGQETERCHRHGELLKKQFGDVKYPVAPAPDKKNDNHEVKFYALNIGVDNECIERFTQKWVLSLNGLIVLATAMAIMEMEESEKAGLTWSYMGRDSEDEQRIFGSLHRDIPICIERGKIDEMIIETRRNIRESLALSDYPYTLTQPSNCVWHKAVNVNIAPSWQKFIDELPKGMELIDVQMDWSGCYMDVEVQENPLSICIRYDTASFSLSKIQRFAETIKSNIVKLLKV